MTDQTKQFISEMLDATSGPVTGADLIEGQRIWAPGWAFNVGPVAVELIVVNSAVEKDSNRIHVAYVNDEDSRYHAASRDVHGSDNRFIYLGDLGVRPYNYDSRLPQVFFTREAMEAAIETWDGRNPNFIFVE